MDDSPQTPRPPDDPPPDDPSSAPSEAAIASAAPEPAAPPPGAPLRSAAFAGALIVAATALAYLNSFSGPFVFDDQRTILENPTIRNLWPLGPVLFPPPEIFSAGRPLLNLSFAVDHAIGGTGVRAYHLTNLLIHLGAALTLFGVVRRTLEFPRFRARFGAVAVPLAAAAALLWSVHPVLTQSVTYISQRAESLMGCCALLTLYCFARSRAAGASGAWSIGAVVACLLGLAAKETMVVVPFLVLVYDAVFLSGSLRSAWRGGAKRHGALFATWAVAAGLIASSNLAARDVGFTGIYTSLSYALIQGPVVLHYFSLGAWPASLVFDYGARLQWPAATTIVAIAVLSLALAAIAWGFRRRPAFAFLGAWVFIFLAPTSSFIPVQTQPMAENRLYTPLAAGSVALAVASYALLGRRAWIVHGFLALALGGLTARRNETYRTELGLWTDTAQKAPGNPRAHNIRGVILTSLPNRAPEAVASIERALAIDPQFEHAHYNLANALQRLPGREADAVAHYRLALEAAPDRADAHNNLANLLARSPENRDAAIGHFRAALKAQPTYASAHLNLAGLLAASAESTAEAVTHYEEALRLVPRSALAHFNYAQFLATQPGGVPAALKHYEEALRLRPELAEIHINYGALLAQIPERTAEAITHFETAVKLSPDSLEARYNLASLLFNAPGRRAEAIEHFKEVLRLRPDLDDIRRLLQQLGVELPAR